MNEHLKNCLRGAISWQWKTPWILAMLDCEILLKCHWFSPFLQSWHTSLILLNIVEKVVLGSQWGLVTSFDKTLIACNLYADLECKHWHVSYCRLDWIVIEQFSALSAIVQQCKMHASDAVTRTLDYRSIERISGARSTCTVDCNTNLMILPNSLWSKSSVQTR